MPSLERFFSPSVRFLDKNLKSLPGARLYFFSANSTTLKATFSDKVGNTPNSNPVVADSNGIFPPIFLSGLYRVELRDKNNKVQPGWPIDNVGQDSAIVPFAPWSEIVTYQTDDVVTSPDGFWFRSRGDSNVGNDPDSNPAQWELIVIPIAANFTSNVPWATWSDSGNQLSLNIDAGGLQTLLNNHYTRRGNNLSDLDSASNARDNLGLGSAAVIGYQTAKVELGGDFNSGSEVICTRVGNMVTVTGDGVLNHTSSSNPVSSSGDLPEAFRPNSSVSNIYTNLVGNIRQVLVSSAGSVSCSYRDSDGNLIAQSSTATTFSISYVVE